MSRRTRRKGKKVEKDDDDDERGERRGRGRCFVKCARERENPEAFA